MIKEKQGRDTNGTIRYTAGRQGIRLRTGYKGQAADPAKSWRGCWQELLGKTPSGKHPDLQILLITSRKNTAEAEAFKLDIDCKIHTSRLIDIHDKDWYEDFPGNLMVCTNAYIEYFLKNLYRRDNPKTHLWNKFDLIFVDEVHSLTSDAFFAPSSFAVERFIHHTLRMNRSCDIVAMSGTPASTDWLYTEEHWGTKYASIDLYDECIHLVPDIVSMMKKEVVSERIFNIWSHGNRLIYFVNSVASMSDLVTKLIAHGIPEQDIAIAFSNSDNAEKLPSTLVEKRNSVRQHLVEHMSLPADVKIYITTSQNKEGISIEDDDIKYMFSESHNKADLEQMAGRVRGNPYTGTGIYALVVVYDANDHRREWSFLECELDRKLINHVPEILALHKSTFEQTGKNYDLDIDIDSIQKKHRYLMYDYIKEKFCHFTGREMCEKQIIADRIELDSYIEIFDEILYYYSDSSGYTYAATGRGEFARNWFPYSKVYQAPDRPAGPKEMATAELLSFLQQNNLIDIEITHKKAEEVMAEICRLIIIYGQQELGFDTKPITLGPALRRFNMECESPSHHNRNKIIHLKQRN